MKHIASRDNATFKRLRALSEDGRFRRAEQSTLLDGAHLIQAALAAGVPLVRAAVTPVSATQDELARLLSSLMATGCELVEMPEALLRAVSPVDTPSGIVAEMRIPEPAAAAAASRDMLLVESVQDAGNLGTLFRTAAAAGVSRVVLSAGCAQAWSPRVLRAGMGAHFSLHITERASLEAVLADWRGDVLATALDAHAANLFALDLRGPVAWMFGSEGKGLNPGLLARASCLVQIPMASGTESLNVAAAAAVCLFEQVRQRLD